MCKFRKTPISPVDSPMGIGAIAPTLSLVIYMHFERQSNKPLFIRTSCLTLSLGTYPVADIKTSYGGWVFHLKMPLSGLWLSHSGLRWKPSNSLVNGID